MKVTTFPEQPGYYWTKERKKWILCMVVRYSHGKDSVRGVIPFGRGVGQEDFIDRSNRTKFYGPITPPVEDGG